MFHPNRAIQMDVELELRGNLIQTKNEPGVKVVMSCIIFYQKLIRTVAMMKVTVKHALRSCFRIGRLPRKTLPQRRTRCEQDILKARECQNGNNILRHNVISR